jgi:hypothetical protein
MIVQYGDGREKEGGKGLVVIFFKVGGMNEEAG